jgi:cell fate regulator YaaT (PSP1 superfamily)
MGCSSCGTGGGCAPKGCKSNGTCGTTGCNKLNVYDWLCDMELPEAYKPFNVIEVRFKGSRKEFYRNDSGLELFTGDAVLVQCDMGNDIGFVSLKGELVRLQLKKYNIDENSAEMFRILRVASARDMERYEELKAKEPSMLERARTLAMGLGLKMKLSDIEIQGDGKKVIFFYTAEERVDFRELIKSYAEEFRMRIEMKQIGYRQEAARLGGIGSCGRELCCSTWLTDFKVVNMSAARYQHLSINMLKLSGQCGRLKCCLNYELDTYLEALREFPSGDTVKIETVSGTAYSQKVDILKRMMWFSYAGNSAWIPLEVGKVNEFLEKNKKGEKAPDLSVVQEGSRAMIKALDAEDIISDNVLTRMEEKDQRDRNRKKRKKKSKNKKSFSSPPKDKPH